MRAVTRDNDGRLVIAEASKPTLAPTEALVRTEMISVNRGDLRYAMAAAPGFRPGWDLAGRIEVAATDGSGPPMGTQVVGLSVKGAGWAEYSAVPTHALAEIPDSVGMADAVCLPVAGLTALHALGDPSKLRGRRILVTGASGGVGHFACQIAAHAGARVVGAIRSPGDREFVLASGAEEVAVTGDDIDAARVFGPYDLILESIGGASLTGSLTMLAPSGTCILFGSTDPSPAVIDVEAFYRAGGINLYGFGLFTHLSRNEPASVGLKELMLMVQSAVLLPKITVVRPWSDLEAVAESLLERRFAGKAVLTL